MVNACAYKTAVVKIGFVESCIADGAAPEIDVYQLGTFKCAVTNYCSRQGKELQIPGGEIAGQEGGKIKKAHSHNSAGKKAHGKSCAHKIAAVELPVGKVHPFKMQSLDGNIPYRPVLRDVFAQSPGIGLRVCGMHGAKGGACYGRSSTAGGTKAMGKHRLSILLFFHIE